MAVSRVTAMPSLCHPTARRHGLRRHLVGGFVSGCAEQDRCGRWARILPIFSGCDACHTPTPRVSLATRDGLVRFDGVRFVVFNTGNTDELPSNRLIGLAPGRDGALWVRTEQNHLARLHDGAFTHFDERRGLRGGSTLVVHVDAAGTVWAGTEDGLHVLEGERFRSGVAGTIREEVEALCQLGFASSGHGQKTNPARTVVSLDIALDVPDSSRFSDLQLP